MWYLFEFNWCEVATYFLLQKIRKTTKKQNCVTKLPQIFINKKYVQLVEITLFWSQLHSTKENDQKKNFNSRFGG